MKTLLFLVLLAAGVFSYPSPASDSPQQGKTSFSPVWFPVPLPPAPLGYFQVNGLNEYRALPCQYIGHQHIGSPWSPMVQTYPCQQSLYPLRWNYQSNSFYMDIFAPYTFQGPQQAQSPQSPSTGASSGY
uniref:Secreted protein n=1 Tax=Steinernema glaseri TaxID=37863 RepID=A0A1I7ZFH7_9BILA